MSLGENTYSGGILGSDFKSSWVEPEDLLLEVIGIVKGVVSDIDVALEGECKLSVGEELGGN